MATVTKVYGYWMPVTIANTTKNRAPSKKLNLWGKEDQREKTERAPSPGSRQNTHRGARTHDHKVKGLALCRLS